MVGNVGKLSQHSSACLQTLTQQLQAGNSAERIVCLDAFIAPKKKKKTKEKLMVLKTYRGKRVEIDVCDQNKSHQVFAQSLHPTCSLLRAWGEETFRHFTWAEMGKDNIIHTDKLPKRRQNAGECKSWCFSCSNFTMGITIAASLLWGYREHRKANFSYGHLCPFNF